MLNLRQRPMFRVLWRFFRSPMMAGTVRSYMVKGPHSGFFRYGASRHKLFRYSKDDKNSFRTFKVGVPLLTFFNYPHYWMIHFCLGKFYARDNILNRKEIANSRLTPEGTAALTHRKNTTALSISGNDVVWYLLQSEMPGHIRCIKIICTKKKQKKKTTVFQF